MSFDKVYGRRPTSGVLLSRYCHNMCGNRRKERFTHSHLKISRFFLSKLHIVYCVNHMRPLEFKGCIAMLVIYTLA